MGHRARGKNKLPVSRAESVRTLLLVIVVSIIPVLGTVYVTATTTEPDLSEHSAIRERAGNYLVLSWPALLQDHTGVSGAGTGIPSGTEVQALGYMMDGEPGVAAGKLVQEFLLLPEAGNLLHPAHRMRDQMIAVHLEHGTQVQFSPRALVWVWGEFRVAGGMGNRLDAIYILEKAQAKPADRADIRKYFK